MNPELNTELNTEMPVETESSQEKQQVEKLKKEQKDFEAAKFLKVFLKNTKGKIQTQKELLKEALKIDEND